MNCKQKIKPKGIRIKAKNFDNVILFPNRHTENIKEVKIPSMRCRKIDMIDWKFNL